MDARVAKNRLVSEGNAWFYTLVLPLSLSLSPSGPALFIFIIPWARHRSYDRRKRIAKGAKGKRPARARGPRPEHVNGPGENGSNTVGFFWKQTPIGHRLNYRLNIPLQRRIPDEEFSLSLSLPLSFASRSRIRLYDKTRRRRRRRRRIPRYSGESRTKKEKINDRATVLIRLYDSNQALNVIFFQRFSHSRLIKENNNYSY